MADGGFNAINILFRLTSEDNLTGGFNQAKNAMASVDEQAGKLQMSMTKINAAMDGMDPAMINKVTSAFDGTDAATNKYNEDLSKVLAKMKEVGASQQEIQDVNAKLTSMRDTEDKNTTALGGMQKGLSGIAIAAGAAFTMAGYYLENFVQQCLQASMTIQQQNMEIGASMGLNAQQSLQQGPAIQNMLNNVEGATGQNVQQLRAITPSVGLVAGGNTTLTQSDLEAISAMTYARQGSGATLGGISGVYNKMVTSGATNPLSQMGISLEDMGMTRTEFQKLSPEERQNVINNAVLGKLGFMNSDVAGTTGAQLQVFQGRLTQFMADLGDSFLPTLNVVMDVAEGLFKVAESIPGLMPLIGALLLLITGVTVVLGPLLIMIQLFDADSIATIFGMASAGIEALNAVMVPYLEELAVRITEEGLLPALQWAYAAAIDGVSLSSIYATAKEWLLVASQIAVGDSGIAAAGGLTTLAGAIWGVFGAISGVLGLSGIFASILAFFSGLFGAGSGLTAITGGEIAATGAFTSLGAIITEVAGYIWLFGSTLMYYFIEPFADFLGSGAVAMLPAFASGLSDIIAVLVGGPEAIFGGFFKGNPIYNMIHGEPIIDPKQLEEARAQLLSIFKGNIGINFNSAEFMNSLKGIKDAIWNTLSGLGGNMYNWGKNLLGNFVSGIEASIPGLSNVLQDIANYFPHSPPTKGPLSTITAMNMKNWMSGIMSAGSGAFNSGLSNLSGIGNTIGSTASSTFNSISHGPIQIDASQMSPDELMAMMTYICEKYLLPGESTLPTGPSATKTSSSNKTTPTPAEGILPTLPTIGGSGIVPTLPTIGGSGIVPTV